MERINKNSDSIDISCLNEAIKRYFDMGKEIYLGNKMPYFRFINLPFTQEMKDDIVVSNQNLLLDLVCNPNSDSIDDELPPFHNGGMLVDFTDMEEEKKEAITTTKKCTCDFVTVILRYGCQCGGE